MQNEGKRFEEDIKNSTPEECFYYRFKDGTGNFAGGKNENVRFQAQNMCDCMIMDKYLFLLELKSHKGVSIPISCIRKNQIEEMSKIEHGNIRAYFIFNFREKEKTYAVEARTVKEYIETTDKKSIPILWCKENGITITGEKKKVRFRYDLKKFFNEAAEN